MGQRGVVNGVVWRVELQLRSLVPRARDFGELAVDLVLSVGEEAERGGDLGDGGGAGEGVGAVGLAGVGNGVAEVFEGEGVGGVDVVVAWQAEFGRVGLAEEKGGSGVAVVAGEHGLG